MKSEKEFRGKAGALRSGIHYAVLLPVLKVILCPASILYPLALDHVQFPECHTQVDPEFPSDANPGVALTYYLS